MEYTREFKLSCEKREVNFKAMQITSVEKACEFARQFYHEDISIYESCFMILLDNANNTIGWVKISQGGINSTTIDVRIMAKYALEAMATSIIIVHNHPSGNLVPSIQDENITKKCVETFKLFDCQILDHIILSECSYYSFKESGKL